MRGLRDGVNGLKDIYYQQEADWNLRFFLLISCKIRLFLKVLMAGVAINLCEWRRFLLSCFLYQKQSNEKRRKIERFVWRLDCRLKYVCYLSVLKFVIFGYFWGKMYLFSRSLWRALQSGNSPVDFRTVSLLCVNNTNHTDRTKIVSWYICVTVGLSSEVCLLPTSNKICDFWLFSG